MEITYRAWSEWTKGGQEILEQLERGIVRYWWEDLEDDES